MQFEYHQPDQVDGVVDLLAKHGADAAPLAGGTALLIDMQHGELAPQHLVSLWGVPELRRIQVNGGLHIGALATLSELVETLQKEAPLAGLEEAALMVGGRQIQNAATVGGNICKASPGADMVPPLLCLDAELTLRGPEGERAAPLDGFLTGPDQTALGPAEILTGIYLPQPQSRTGTAFLKVMRRRAVDCSIVSVAARITLEEDHRTCAQARIAVAAAAPNPFRAGAAEAALENKVLNEDAAEAAGRLAREASTPIDDVRASAEYRRMLVETLVTRTVMAAFARAGA